MVDSALISEKRRFVIYQNDRLSLFDTKNKNEVVSFEFKKTGAIREPADRMVRVQQYSIEALYGVIQLLGGRYLLAVTKSLIIGQVWQRKIFQVEELQFFPIRPGGSPGNVQAGDKPYVNELRQFFRMKHLYYSFHYDLTNSMQRFVDNQLAIDRKDSRYFWNEWLVQDLVKSKSTEWVVGFISGYINNIKYEQVSSKAVEFLIVSRRDKRRQGMRFVSRGCNLDGHCTNSVETEQLLHLVQDKTYYSYVQTRGSIPFKWTQKPDMKWSPKVQIFPDDELNAKLMRKHYEDQVERYSKLTLVNLIDRKGSKTQKSIGEKFEQLHSRAKSEHTRLVWFDFHHECRKMKYENLSILMDMLTKQLQNFNYLVIKYDNYKLAGKSSVQCGVVRTNCMDCLDRTNVVQSVIGRRVLHKMLSEAGISPKSTKITAFEKLPYALEQTFRAVWTNNADVMSLLYSGTPAQKTDFTRLGKRTMKGQLNDLRFGVQRYFLGNFYDYQKQNTIDLALGKIKAKDYSPKYPLIPGALIMFLIILASVCAINFAIGFECSRRDIVADCDEHWLPISAVTLGIGILAGLKLNVSLKGALVKKPKIND